MSPISNTAWLALDRGIRLGFGFVLTSWMARYLGPEQFGLFSYAVAVVAIFTPLSNPGLDSTVVRTFVETPRNGSRTLTSAVVIRLFGATLSIIFTLCLALTLQEHDTELHWLVFILSLGLIFQSLDIVELWFQAKLKWNYPVLGKLTAFAVACCARVFLLWIKAPLLSFAIIATLELALSAACYACLYKWRGESTSPLIFDKQIAKKLLLESWPLAISGFAIILYMRLDQLMLSYLAGPDALGLYSAAIRITEVGYVVPTLLSAVTLPRIITLRMRSASAYAGELRRYYCIIFYLGLIVALPTSLYAETIVHLLMGSQYAPAAEILQILAWSNISVFLGTASTQFLIAERLQRISLIRTLLGLFCNVALNLILIPRYGARGAAMATLVSFAIPTLSLAFFASTRSQLHLMFVAINPLKIRQTLQNESTQR